MLYEILAELIARAFERAEEQRARCCEHCGSSDVVLDRSEAVLECLTCQHVTFA